MQTTRFARGLAGVLGAFLLLVAAGAEGVDRDPSAILQRMREAMEPSKDMHAAFDLEMINANGESVHWTGKYYRRGSGVDARLRLAFDSPLDLRGTEVTAARTADGLSHMRIYLPALRRARVIDGDARGESFLGTDFNYEDIGLEQLGPEPTELHGDNTIEGRACYRLSSRPGRGWWYGKILRFIDKKTYLPLRTEYYDRSDTLWKVRTLDRVVTIDGIPTATAITMRTVPTRTATTITLDDLHYDRRLPDEIFGIR